MAEVQIANAPSMLPSARRLIPQLLVAGVCPVIAYSLLRPHLGSDALTLCLVMVFPVVEIGYERVHYGRFEPIGIIALIGIALGIAGALIFNGNTFLLKMRDSVVTGMFGVLCLASLPARRPVMFYLGREFATEGDSTKRAEFDETWELPGVPARFRLVTAVWGVGLVGEAAGRTVLALILPTGTFLAAALVLNVAVLGGLFLFTARFIRHSQAKTLAAVAAAGSPASGPPGPTGA